MTVTLLAVVRKIERFFHCGVAAADDQHFLATIEETIAGGAGGYAEALEFLFAFHAQPARLVRPWR